MQAEESCRDARGRDTVTIPSFPFPEDAALALARATRYGEWRISDLGEIPEFEDVDVAAGHGRRSPTALARIGERGRMARTAGGRVRCSMPSGFHDLPRRCATTEEEALEPHVDIGGSGRTEGRIFGSTAQVGCRWRRCSMSKVTRRCPPGSAAIAEAVPNRDGILVQEMVAADTRCSWA